jgi:hypothetical protein
MVLADHLAKRSRTQAVGKRTRRGLGQSGSLEQRGRGFLHVSLGSRD